MGHHGKIIIQKLRRSAYFMTPDELILHIKQKVDELGDVGVKNPKEAHKLEYNLMRQVILYLFQYNPDPFTKEILRPMVKSFDIEFERWSDE